MSLLREIREISPDAADILKKVGFDRDTDIQSLTRQDLNELFPGAENLRLRKIISDRIQNAKPVNAVLKELLDFIPDDCVKEALAKDGVVSDYLFILKDLKAKVENLQSFLEAHIGLFEEYAKKHKKSSARPTSLSTNQPRHAPDERHHHGQTHDHGQGNVAAPPTVKIQTIVRGQTFDSHRALLQRVKQVGGLHVEETTSAKVLVLFCPVTSRHMTDIEAAMSEVPEGATVILVVMHHTYDTNYTNITRSLSGDHSWEVEDFMDVLYHDSVPGLLTCPLNDKTVAQLHAALLKHSTVTPVAAPVYSGGSTGRGYSGGNTAGMYSGGNTAYMYSGGSPGHGYGASSTGHMNSGGSTGKTSGGGWGKGWFGGGKS